MIDPLSDGISSVELLTYMGDDLTVVNAARVSLNKTSEWGPVGVNRLKKEDAKLISYLANHGHWTPFSHPMFTFRIKMPIFVAREWFRHNMIDLGDGDIKPGFARNEVSRRYVDSAPEMYIPEDGTWRGRAPGVKQGSAGPLAETSGLEFYGRQRQFDAALAYNHLIEDEGVAPEMARMVLPQSMYTEFYETASLYAYANLCRQRIAPDAMAETRWYAEAIARVIALLCPVSWAALKKANERPRKMRELLERLKTAELNPATVAEIEEVLS